MSRAACRTAVLALVLLLLPLSAAAAAPAGGGATGDPAASALDKAGDPAGLDKAGDPADHELAKRLGACDALDPAQCLLPFPNDRFTVPDSRTPTGRRVALSRLAMPRNAAGKPVDPTEWNRNDGFSPGAMPITFVPGLHLGETFGLGRRGIDHLIEDPSISLERHSPVVILDAGPAGARRPHRPTRHPFWAELDRHPDTPDDRRMLILRPTVNFREGHRYIVALRDMRDESGAPIEARPAFRRIRDGDGPAEPGSRRAHYEREIFPVLERAGVDRDELYLAWDFTVASTRSLAGRALAIRDDAFARLGDDDLSDGEVDGRSPQFSVTEVVEYTRAENADTRRVVRGNVTVPNYLRYPDEATTPEVRDPTGQLEDLPPQMVPGTRFHYGTPSPGPMATPVRNPADPNLRAEFVCSIPRTASPGDPARPMVYGHGLLGSKGESTGGSTDRMRERGFLPCAVDWIGMSSQDIANVVTILGDISNFPSLADRAQQGFLNFLYLGRALVHEEGFRSHAAFRTDGGRPLLGSGELVYDGNSQGAIMGGALTALAPDFRRSVLGVPGMNYSTLLNRSVDWEGAYAEVTYAAYPDKQVQQLLFNLLQMLWDRAEANGYARHMTTDPLRDTPPHRVLLHAAFGDYQVANVAAEVEARTVGAALLETSVPDRHWAVDPSFGFGRTFGGPGEGRASRHAGSALVYWDSGNPTPPDHNVPPRDRGADPHEHPRRDPFAARQKARFYRSGVVHDVHDGGPYCTYAYPVHGDVVAGC